MAQFYMHPRDLVLGLSIKRKPEGEIYIWAFRVGNEVKYVEENLVFFRGDRMALTRHCMHDILHAITYEDEDASPRAIYLFRETDFSVTTHRMLKNEFRGIKEYIKMFYEHLPYPYPRKTFVTVTSGSNYWADFVLAGGGGPYDTESSYWIYGPRSALFIDRIAHLVELTNANSFGTGFIRVCWKASNYFNMQNMLAGARRRSRGDDLDEANRARRLIAILDSLIHRY